MAETITEMILPGTYIEVRPEGLIGVGGISTGNIGIIGTAAKGELDTPITISSYADARQIFGEYDPWVNGSSNELTLVRALEQIYNNGGSTVIAVRVAKNAAKADYALQSSSDNHCATLTAKTEGTWGNEISINVWDADDDSFIVGEEHAGDGNPITLDRGNIKKSGRNSIKVIDGTTEQTNIFEVIYTGTVGAGKVKINQSTGVLTFHDQGGANDETPKTGDLLFASYVVKKENSVKVTIQHNNIIETFNVVDAKNLMENLNSQSLLVDAESVDAHKFEIPKKSSSEDEYLLFGRGSNTSGNNGESASTTEYKGGLGKLIEEPVNIVLAAGLAFDAIVSALGGHLESTENQGRDRIGFVGSALDDDVDTVLGYADRVSNDRLILVAPGIKTTDSASGNVVSLPGAYAAAAMAGLISSLGVHVSPTNKRLNIRALEKKFNQGQLKNLVQNRVLALEEKRGYRVVRGITTDEGAFRQITTRRIVDFAKAGTRLGSLPYIGRLNNTRVRAALKSTLDGFLSNMLQDEQLVGYTLNVTASRQDEINGRVIVTMVLQPVFSIDYIKVIMFLE